MDSMKWKLGSRSIYASITIYNGVPKVHVRYHKEFVDGTSRPAKNGIALNFDEWEAFKSHVDSIDLELRRVQSQKIETLPVLDLSQFYRAENQGIPSVSHEYEIFEEGQ